MKKNIGIIAVIVITALYLIYKFFLSGQSEFSVEPAKFQGLANDKDAVVLDVRSAFEFGGDKIAGALNMSYSAADFKGRVGMLDKEKTYLIYCASGTRSAASCSEMKSLGFKHLYSLKGGIEHWKSAGLPVVR